MPSRLWSNEWPNVRLCRLLGSWIALQALVEIATNCQTLQAAGELDALQALVEIVTKRQTLQAAGELDALQALVE